ncbi:MAG: adenylyltransferase/cytidyltransferase family protein [Candidatus Lokiarchaeota archaeon]|nr:adenylyltransferase/cytidyltransferase family protein [Candidatus Lokiarchaeota archaeon]
MPKKISLVSGGFDPVHEGHISLLQESSRFSDILIVALNSDSWLKRKKGQPFMTFFSRKIVLESIKYVDYVIGFDDSDGSASHAIEKVRDTYPDAIIYFCNGGDRTGENTPETEACRKYDVRMVFNVGGGKIQSSSDMLKKWTRSESKS